MRELNPRFHLLDMLPQNTAPEHQYGLGLGQRAALLTLQVVSSAASFISWALHCSSRDHSRRTAAATDGAKATRR